jgi:16S rRNA (uracil1498-N3)-methyltransferase
VAAHRFFIPGIDKTARTIRFPDNIARQIRLVLRLKPNDRVLVLDGEGTSFQIQLTRVGENETLGKVLEIQTLKSNIPASIHLFFPLSKHEKVEWILQKGTEVGVSAFHPFISERTLVQKMEVSEKKTSRWESIIREAAEQSRRTDLPELFPSDALEHVVQIAVEQSNRTLVAWVAEEQGTIKEALADLKDQAQSIPSIAVFVGPEGGFSDREIDQLKTQAAHTVSLGSYILRMETAAILFPALVLHELS